MSFSVTEPSLRQKWIAGILVIGYALITMLPLLWIVATGFKSSTDSIGDDETIGAANFVSEFGQFPFISGHRNDSTGEFRRVA